MILIAPNFQEQKVFRPKNCDVEGKKQRRFPKTIAWQHGKRSLKLKSVLDGFSFKRFSSTFAQGSFNQRRTDVGQILDERSVQTASMPINIFKNKGNVEAMLSESLNQFKFDSTHFQQAFNILLQFQQCWTTCSNAPDIWFNKVLNAC